MLGLKRNPQYTHGRKVPMLLLQYHASTVEQITVSPYYILYKITYNINKQHDTAL